MSIQHFFMAICLKYFEKMCNLFTFVIHSHDYNY